MKKVVAVLILLLTTQLVTASDITDIKTNDELRKFLDEKVGAGWSKYATIDDNKIDTSTYGVGKFFQVDVDGDGSTDLLINGNRLFAVLDKGHKQYEIHIVGGEHPRSGWQYELINIVVMYHRPALLVESYKDFDDSVDGNIRIKTDSLTFKFGDFIEYNANPVRLQIQGIRLKTSMCFGECPIFELRIGACK